MSFITLRILVLFFLVTTLARSDIIPSSDGEYVDCVDKRQQRAFDNPLLKNHQLQEVPSDVPKSMRRTKSKWVTREAYVSTANCPEGTIPVRQEQETVQYNIDKLTHEYATGRTKNTREIYGAKSAVNVWAPKVENGSHEMSISQVWITNGDYKTNDLNTIEVGWQVYPDYYLDNKPRFFIFWTSDTYENGCYNLRCDGFIQTSRSIVLGGPISPVSALDGHQFEIIIFVWKDRIHGNWWLSVGPNNTLVGYWPAEIFKNLADHATTVEWGGEITNSHMFDRHTTTEMGSGHFPNEGFGKTSFFRNLEIVDNTNILQSIRSLMMQPDNPKFYDIQNQFTEDWGSYLFYGGSGVSRMHSGAVRLSLCSCLFCFCLSLFFWYFH